MTDTHLPAAASLMDGLVNEAIVDLTVALAENPLAQVGLDKLQADTQRDLLEPILRAKTPASRAERINHLIEMLHHMETGC